jgi:hypothetical protein
MWVIWEKLEFAIIGGLVLTVVVAFLAPALA